MADSNLIIAGVSKRYRGDIWGLRKFSLTIKSGVLGLIGPNGAGKSTLMRILATVTKPTEGGVSWNDIDIVHSPEKIRRTIGYLPQDFGVYPNLNAFEFLTYLAAARGIVGRLARQRIDRLLEIVNLAHVRKQPLGSFSGGMKQRVGVAQALLNDPKLVIVDEPTAGLDPEERVRFRNLLSELSGDRVVILSSHIVSDVEATATSVAIVNNGRLVAHASPEYLLKKVAGKVWELDVASSDMLELRKNHIVGGAITTSDGVRARIVTHTHTHTTARSVPPTLEDAYLYLIADARENSST
jgi:ABC-type multidrug transport system ATPase subunit